MIIIKKPRTLRARLIIYFTIISIVPSILISMFYYSYSTKALKNTMLNDAYVNEAYIIDNIDNELKIAVKLSDWMFLNKSLEKVLMEPSLNKPNFTYDLINAKDLLENTVMDSSISKGISAIIISSKNGVNLRYGDDAALINSKELENKPWFKESIGKKGDVYFQGMVENPALVKHDNYVIPIIRPVIESTTESDIGWSYIALRESLVSDIYSEFYKQNNNPIYIIDKSGTCVSSSEKQWVGKSMTNEEFIKPVLDSARSGSFDLKDKKSSSLVVFKKSNLTGWSLVQKISYAPLYEQTAVLLRTSIGIFIGSILIASLFTMFISSNLTQPLKRILNRMRKISNGNFERDPSLEGNDEMGELGIGINELACNVSELLVKVKEEEAKKRNLELMVLQNQVNPHFLYNTLNSIKWMATVQKADGIRDIVSALGRLLMNISKEKSEEISIRRELMLTEDYILIQNVRYNGKIKLQVNVHDEKLLDSGILKFTLQPIVENAIFHGIEPKKDSGSIMIDIIEQNDEVVISIMDDGIGMDEERIKEILHKDEKHENRGFRSIGMKNVDDRIKLFYGSNFGLHIESKVNEYTKVDIRIPNNRNLDI
jgi:two-component system sensor histidine kinase YesM